MSVEESSQHWGILGGTFDPVHCGHLTLADQLMDVTSLEKVLFVPTYKHPNKRREIYAGYDERVKMLAIALENYPQFEVSQIEHEIDLSGYSVDTVLALKKRFPTVQFSFIIGMDNLESFAQWRTPNELLGEARLLVGSRPGSAPKIPSALKADRIDVYSTEAVEVSSTGIRAAIKQGNRDAIRSVLPPGVYEYIERKSLYR